MNKNWGDRADKDLFFTILSVKNIGVISGAEWSVIGNTMRVMGYGFTNEGCRQHFQGLRRAQNKAAASIPQHPTSPFGQDPTLNPITRRPGPGRGRPRKNPLPTTNVTAPTGPVSTSSATHHQPAVSTPNYHSPHPPNLHLHHHELPPRPIAGGSDYVTLAAQYPSEPSQRPTPPSTQDATLGGNTAVPASTTSASENDDAPGEDADEPPSKRQRTDEPCLEADILVDDVVTSTVQLFEPGEPPVIKDRSKDDPAPLAHDSNDIVGTISVLDSDQIEEESDDDMEDDDEEAGLDQHSDFGASHGEDQESNHDAEEAVLSLVGAATRPGDGISNQSTPGWGSPAEAGFGEP